MTEGVLASSRSGWAVTGLACRYPGIVSTQALWQRLCDAPRTHTKVPVDTATRRLPAPASTYADFGVPPIYRSSINRVQLDVFELAREALAQAGIADGGIDTERCDVIFCTAFGMNRCFENQARVLGVELATAYARALPADEQPPFLAAAKLRLDRAFTATSHDKVGEMASSVASRIAACFKLRGRALAMEAQDIGGIEALLAATEALEQGHAHSVLIVGAQRIESALMHQVLSQQFGAQAAAALCEGACALVLQGRDVVSTRVLARLSDVRLLPPQAPAAWADFLSPARPGTAPYCAVGGLLDPEEWQTLEAGGGSVRSASEPCGHGYAIEGLTTLIHAVLAQQHQHDSQAASSAGPVLALGKGLHGHTYALSLQAAGHVGEAAAPSPRTLASPVAVLGLGARFGPTTGTTGYWDALCSAQPQFRPLEGRRFRPEIYRTDNDTTALSYYIGAASYADLPVETAADAGITAPAFGLAAAAAREALAQLRSPAHWAGEAVLVVSASNFTLGPERRWAAQEYLPRIEHEIETLAAERELTPGQRAQGLRALHDAACLPQAHDGTPADLSGRMVASEISRAIGARFGAAGARAVAVEAACAGSLAAIELAINSLRSGRSKLAIVAGVELPVNVHDLCLCSAQRMLAPDLIATFTEQATGFTPGDGAGVLVLALEDEARRCGEEVLALLRAVASCTESKSILAPNPSGQIKSMQRAFLQVDFQAAEVDFVETHGTGTLIGDEVEVESLAHVYAGSRATALRLGALKAQFGHCFSAAGMASVIKTVLALRHERLPANHFAHPIKSGLRLEERGFDPLMHASEWPRGAGRTRRAAVNAFGTGGVNVHLLLEDGGE